MSERREPSWRPRLTERDMQLLHASVYVYLRQQGRYDREVAELLERVAAGHAALAAASSGDTETAT